MAKGNSYYSKGGRTAFGGVNNARGSLAYGAMMNTISRRDAANLARRKSMGGKGG